MFCVTITSCVGEVGTWAAHTTRNNVQNQISHGKVHPSWLLHEMLLREATAVVTQNAENPGLSGRTLGALYLCDAWNAPDFDAHAAISTQLL